MAFDYAKYTQEYKKAHYDKINLKVDDFFYQLVQEQADLRGISKSKFILQSFYEYYNVDLKEKRG